MKVKGLSLLICLMIGAATLVGCGSEKTAESSASSAASTTAAAGCRGYASRRKSG